jgi:hypothetical protein
MFEISIFHNECQTELKLVGRFGEAVPSELSPPLFFHFGSGVELLHSMDNRIEGFSARILVKFGGKVKFLGSLVSRVMQF